MPAASGFSMSMATRVHGTIEDLTIGEHMRNRFSMSAILTLLIFALGAQGAAAQGAAQSNFTIQESSTIPMGLP